jgi:Putative zincin peptidase
MKYQVEDLEDQSKFRQILVVPYSELINFVFDYLKKRSGLVVTYYAMCIFFLGIAVNVRINIAGSFPSANIFFQAALGLIVFPLISVPVHELLHILPYYISGARNIRIGMDLKQYLFYVTAHRYVASPLQFVIVALTPFLIISVSVTLLIFLLPGVWKWSLSLFLFVHATFCAGDIALLNLYFINRNKKIYTWDDADTKTAYFYEKIEE